MNSTEEARSVEPNAKLYLKRNKHVKDNYDDLVIENIFHKANFAPY